MSTSRLLRRSVAALCWRCRKTSLRVWTPVELVQPVELALVEREHVLELVEPRGGAVDVVLERADLGGDDGDLRGEHALALAGRLDLLLEHVDAAVDDLLSLPDPFLPRGRRDHQEETGQQEAGEQAHAHPWVVSSGGRPSLPGRPASSLAAILLKSYCGPGSGTIAGVGGSPSSGGGYGSGITAGSGGVPSSGGGYGSGTGVGSCGSSGSMPLPYPGRSAFTRAELPARGSSDRSAAAASRRSGPTSAR